MPILRDVPSSLRSCYRAKAVFLIVNVNVPPFEPLDLGKPAPCQKKEAEGRDCISTFRLFGFGLGQIHSRAAGAPCPTGTAHACARGSALCPRMDLCADPAFPMFRLGSSSYRARRAFGWLGKEYAPLSHAVRQYRPAAPSGPAGSRRMGL